MKPLFFTRMPLLGLLALVGVACSPEETPADELIEEPSTSTSFKQRDGVLAYQEVTRSLGTEAASTAPVLNETFESGSKTSYTDGNATLGSGSWFFFDALIGTSTSDRLTGTKAARLRNYGEIGNNTPIKGAGTVTVQAARYGTDGNSTLELWVSTNGTNYSKVGSTFTVSSTNLTSFSWTVNLTGNVYLDFYKSDGSANRLNIDNVVVTPYGSTGGGSTGGGSTTSPTRDNNLALGNPSGAVTSTSYSTNYLSVKDQFVISYNSSKGQPNWVSWHLSNAWRGSQGRTDDFRADLTLPSSFYRPDENSYSGTGFDRGHMCPSADRTANYTDNSNTFYMSNMVPQAPNNNRIVWENLESYCRKLADQGNELYIISGVSGSGGSGSNGGTTTSIAGGKISVPSHTWKVIVVLPNGSNDVTRITTSTRVIAVRVPNTQSANTQSWGFYRTTVDQIESLTGYNIMSAVSSSIQSTLEARVDNGPTS